MVVLRADKVRRVAVECCFDCVWVTALPCPKPMGAGRAPHVTAWPRTGASSMWCDNTALAAPSRSWTHVEYDEPIAALHAPSCVATSVPCVSFYPHSASPAHSMHPPALTKPIHPPFPPSLRCTSLLCTQEYRVRRAIRAEGGGCGSLYASQSTVRAMS